MFCSNQKFIVNGDTRENLIEVLTCIYKLMNTNSLSQMKIAEDGSHMIFTKYDNQREGFQYIPIYGDVEMVAQIITTYLKSKDAAPHFHSDYEGGDGSYHKGWEIFISDDYTIRGNHICVRPFMTYYSK